MSVDSFIQARVSVDTSSEHSSLPNVHGRPSDPAIDPRWQLDVAGGETAYLKSIASELGEGERTFIAAPEEASSRAPSSSRTMSDVEDVSAGGSRRHSVLRARLKSGKGSNTITTPRASTAVSRSNPLVHGFNDPRSSVSISSTLSTGRKSIAQNPSPSPGQPPTMSSSRRGSGPGQSHVERPRTQSFGTNGPPTASPGPLKLMTDLGSPDDSEYAIAIIGSKGCGKSSLIRKAIKPYPVVEHSSVQIGDHTGEKRHNSSSWQY